MYNTAVYTLVTSELHIKNSK